MNRISKDEYYLNIAKQVASRGTCLRRNYGAVIVKEDVIVSTGYTGAPRFRKNCCDLGTCKRQELKIPSGERYELCRSVHAEQNAIINAGREKCMGATLYLYGWDIENNKPKENPKPCSLCERFILNSGISKLKVFMTIPVGKFDDVQGYTEVQFLSKDDNNYYCIVTFDVQRTFGDSNIELYQALMNSLF